MVGMKRRRLRLGDVLISQGIITEEQLQKGLEVQREKGIKIGEALVEANVVTEEAMGRALSEQLHLDYIDLTNVKIEEEILELVPSALLKKYSILPFAYSTEIANTLRVAMVDPLDMEAIDDINMVTSMQVETVVTTRGSMNLALDKFFGQQEVFSAVSEYAKEKESKIDESEELYSEDVNSSPIVQLVKTMIEQAARQRASDIHIEPMEKQVRIRYRIDGALYERAVYSHRLLSAIVARIKIIGGMDISEKRKPQDGRITQIVDRSEYDIRVSVLPTVYGEKVVMRLTSKNALTLEKKRLGFNDEELVKFDHILENPHGILLVTGPTGSGKSTTLYTALSELNKEDVNIITVEDPVEANIDGINQVQVNPKANLTFASALRSILRQDPDIIMIGEIRDTETAQIAVQASITGHLVVSTLHTNSAASTVTRLIDMGIEPYLIADSVVGVIAQRLVRRLCQECREVYEATREDKEMLEYPMEQPLKLYKPCGCDKCDGTGYKGRIGVYEIMEITPDLKRVIAHNEDAEQIKNVALKGGMKTLRMRARDYAINGTTSVSEVLRVSFDS
ncbi:MAG: Flp pilus assembly complex ATPase component TadA [Lachnospiraceae bacterium]|nr:Flp pilus assembly complex ATPase component TadA [Lachnospiraceae bacterium]